MKWSLLIGKFWGTEIRLHVSMLLLIPYALIAFKPENLASLIRVLLLLTGIFACVALHEMGHTLAARLFDIQVSSIVLWPLGGVANLSRRPETVLPDLIISAAGPIANLILFGGFGFLTILERFVEGTSFFPALVQFLVRTDAFAMLAGLAVANLALAVFNLIPVFPLDGGQIARGLFKGIFGEKRADMLMLVISLPLAIGLTITGLVLRDIAVVLTGLIIILASLTLNLRISNWLTLMVLYFLDRAGYYLKRSDYDSSIREYTRAIERDRDRAGLYVSRAVVYMNLMELSAARADVDCALALETNNFTAWALRGELLVLEKKDAEALAAFERVSELRPTWAVAYLDRGGIYHERGDYARALAEMNKAVELGKGSPVGYLLRSQLRYEMGDLNGAHTDADQALRYAPQWMLSFPEIFQTNQAGHFAWALDYYWRAIERMPNAYQVYQGRGDACRANHRPDWAIADYHRAIRLAPKQAELYLARGRAYQALRQTEQAAADLNAAIALADRDHIKRQAKTYLAQLTPRIPAQKVPATLAVQGPAIDAAAAGAGQSGPAARPPESAG